MKLNPVRALTVILSTVLLLATCAMAETITFTGTVEAGDAVQVYAPIGGKVEAVSAEAGQKVAAGDALVTLSTTKVYAQEAGTVTGVFGQPGDSAETVAQTWGAVISIEGESVYNIAASTDNAYNSTETKFVHVGESVFLSCYSDGNHTGTGVVTALEGTDFTVRVQTGEFLVGETVNVFRGESATAAQRIGRGTLNRTTPTAVTGTGGIVSIAVKPGDAVRRGDVLFETLDGSFDGLYMSGNVIAATEGGIISAVSAQQGGSVQKGDVVATLYPEGAMRVVARIEEANLAAIHVGDPVSVELLWNQDEEIEYPGTVAMISAIANEAAATGGESEATTYDVTIDFTPDEGVRYGMTAVVTTLEAQPADDEVSEDGQD